MIAMKLTIRAATRGDRADWARLRFELWPDCPPARHRLEITQILRSPGVVALARVEEKAIGFAEVSVRSDHVEGTRWSPVPYLEGWYVIPACRGQGVGRALISFVQEWAISNGYSELASDAELENTHSIRLHRRLGFQEVGRSIHFVKPLANKNNNSSDRLNRRSDRKLPEKCLVLKIVSGGQTGSDRAALDWAIANRVPHGGWCPKGRKAEDGRIAARYRLQETPTTRYAARTERNVQDSDGTLIISIHRQLQGGSAATLELARKHRKPCLHVAAAEGPDHAARRLRQFVVEHQIQVLNVAGPRASEEPAVGEFVNCLLTNGLR